MALVLVTAAGCGAAPTTPSGPLPVLPPGSSVPTPGGPQVTDADENRVLQYHVGDTFEVVLHQQTGWTQWSNLSAVDRGVLQPIVDTRAAAARGVTLARFKAAAPGTTEIQASAGASCSPGMACPAIARLWRVTIRVSA
jgi:hypothetical protein